MSYKAQSTTQNASAGLLINANLIGCKQYLAAFKILLICMIPKFVPRLPASSNFGNGISGTALPVKAANSIPLRTSHNMNLNTHPEVIYALRSRILRSQTTLSSDALVHCYIY